LHQRKNTGSGSILVCGRGKPVEIIVKCRLNAVIIVYCAIKFVSVLTVRTTVIQTKVKPTIISKHHRKLQKDVTLLHDNTHPHMANQMVKTVNKLGSN